jgi:O-methyltransferase
MDYMKTMLARTATGEEQLTDAGSRNVAVAGRKFLSLLMLLYEALYQVTVKTKMFDGAFFSLYNYMFTPNQLIFFTQCLVETRTVPGCCVEVGCARGRTTAFLRKFMDENGIAKDYYAIDTFRGFLSQHLKHEVERRQKDPQLGTFFSLNKKKWFDYSLQVSGIDSVKSVETDATKFDFDGIGPIAFALLDVDLYLPMTDVLPKLYRSLSNGGVIVVDDCVENQVWDGAFAAYTEFVSRNGLKREIVLEKLGIIRK